MLVFLVQSEILLPCQISFCIEVLWGGGGAENMPLFPNKSDSNATIIKL